MQKIEYKEKAYNIPSKWSDVTIAQMNAMQTFMQGLNDDDGYDDEHLYSNLFKIFTGLKNFEYYQLPISENLVFKNSLQFIGTKLEHEPYTKTIQHGRYILVVKNFDNITFGEYLDTQHLAGDPGKNMVQLLSMMVDVYEKGGLFKRRKKLDITPDNKIKLINNMPATKLMGLQTFFLRGQKQLGRNTASYLNKMALRLTTKAIFQLVGLFISGLWMRVKKTLQKWMKL